jgi:hypothetical protein
MKGRMGWSVLRRGSSPSVHHTLNKGLSFRPMIRRQWSQGWHAVHLKRVVVVLFLRGRGNVSPDFGCAA